MKYFLICLFFISSTSYATENENAVKCGKVVKFNSIYNSTKHDVSIKTIDEGTVQLSLLKKGNPGNLVQIILTAFATKAKLCVYTLDKSIVSAEITADNE